MGCLGMGVDPEIAKILATLDIKVEEYQKVFEKEAKEAKDAFEKQQKNRKEKLDDLKNKNEKITEEVIKDLNKEELKVEIGFLTNQVDKMHYIFTIGLELVEPIRKVSLDKLKEKAKSAPAITLTKINSQIEEIKNYPTLDFLNSTYGKVLREALEKKGMSATVLKGFKNKLFKERSQRRKVERDLYNIHLIQDGLCLNKKSRPTDFLIFEMNNVFANFYPRNLSVEVTTKLLEKAEQGYYPERSPVGYQRKPKLRNSRHFINKHCFTYFITKLDY